MRLAIAWLLACGSSSAPPPPPPPTPGPAPAPAPGPLVDKWKCDADGDCMNSCSQGAVSKAWYAVTAVRECEDGCANKLAAAPKCIEHACVAFRDSPDGKTTTRNDGCTHKTPDPAPVATTKWSCVADADCMTSCSQGAVNREWYKDAHVNECKDGCEEDAAAPKCVERQCVAYREGPGGTKPDPSCTHRNN